MRILSWYCLIAATTAQLLSLPPALQSIGDALQSLADPEPSDTPKPTPAPAPSPTPKAPIPPPKPTPGPPVQTSSSSIATSSSSSTSTRTTVTSSTSSSSTSSTSTTQQTTSPLLNHAEPAATPTNTGSSDKSDGLSQSAKTGIGVGIGMFVICGLLAAALYSFVRDRHSSEAYAAWRERRREKHTRLGSSSSNFLSSSNFFRGGEKQVELSHVEHGNGTVLGRPTAAPYTMPVAAQSSQSLDKDLPPPPLAYQQAKPVEIKRKPVPQQKPRFSWMH